MSNAKAFQTIANRIIDSASDEEVATIAAIGYKGELPAAEHLDADDKFDLLNAIQDTAKLVEAGFYTRATV